MDNVKNFVIERQAELRIGDNTFVGKINGFDKSIKVYVNENHVIQSMNLYPGVSNRINLKNPIVFFGNIKWK